MEQSKWSNDDELIKLQGRDLQSEAKYSSQLKHQIDSAIKKLEEISGISIPTPEIWIYRKELFYNLPPPYSNLIAELKLPKEGGYRINIYDIETTLKEKDTISHEIYHAFQEEYRKRMGEDNSVLQYILDKKFPLWNGINEAGATIFGYAEAFRQEGLEGKELGIRVLQKIIEWRGKPIGPTKKKVLDLLSADNLAESVAGTGGANWGDVTLIIAAVVLEQNDFDPYKAAKYLLQEPDKILNDILSMGPETIKESVERAEKKIKIREMKDTLRTA